MQMSPIQAARAFALARTFGHEWAIEENRGVLDTEQIRANTKAARCGGFAGIEAPTADGDSEWANVVHTTATRRTRWHIAPDGEVSAAITRPNGTAIDFSIHADGTIGTFLVDRAICRDRHIDAAIEVYEAILDTVEGLSGVEFRDRLLASSDRDPGEAEIALLTMRHFDRIDLDALWDLLVPIVAAERTQESLPMVATGDPTEPPAVDIADYLNPQYAAELMQTAMLDDDLALLPTRRPV